MDNLIERMVKRDLFRHLLSFMLWGGWYAGDVFMEWLREKLDSGGRNLSEATLIEFQQKTSRDLSVVAAEALVLLGYLMVFWVFRTNSF